MTQTTEAAGTRLWRSKTAQSHESSSGESHLQVGLVGLQASWVSFSVSQIQLRE